MILLELRNKGLLSIYYSISQLWTIELLLHYNLRSLLHCMVDLLSIKVGHALLWRHESKFLSIYCIKMCTNAAGLQRSVLLIIWNRMTNVHFRSVLRWVSNFLYNPNKICTTTGDWKIVHILCMIAWMMSTDGPCLSS